VLARAGSATNARLAHFFSRAGPGDGVVDFVRAGVEQIFALEADAGAAQFSVRREANCSGVGRPAKFLNRSWSVLESLPLTCFFVRALEIEERTISVSGT